MPRPSGREISRGRRRVRGISTSWPRCRRDSPPTLTDYRRRYLDDDAWKAKETEYRKQVEGLEAQHATLRDAWSDIVRTNLMAVDELKAELKRKTAARDAAKAARDDRVEPCPLVLVSLRPSR